MDKALIPRDRRERARAMRFIQTGRIQAYALTMILGVFALLSWKLWPYIEPQLRVLL